MSHSDPVEARKAEHLRVSATGDVNARVGAGWQDIRLVHEALPESDFGEIDLGLELFGQSSGKRLRAPLVLAAMTGGHAAARDVNAMLARVSTCNQGQTGPRAAQPGFGSQLTALSGFTHLLGQADGTPALLDGPYIDYIAAGYGTIAVLAALVRRRRTGCGTHIDLSQYETGVQFLAPAMLDFYVNGRVAERQGNRHPSAVPHGVYPCLGVDRWVALSVWDDFEWAEFVAALGAPAWACEKRWTTLLGRKAHEAELDQHIAAWTARLERTDAIDRLRARGLRAALVNSMADTCRRDRAG